MDEIEILLEQMSKDWLYRKDNSPLTELQYDIYLLTDCIEQLLITGQYERLQERTVQFNKYEEKYFDILKRVLEEFNNVIRKKDSIDERFVNSIDVHTDSLWLEYDLKVEYLDNKEMKVVNDMIFAYQTLLRTINTYIKNNDSNVDFIKVEDPTYFDSEPKDYITWLGNFINDQKKLKLED